MSYTYTVRANREKRDLGRFRKMRITDFGYFWQRMCWSFKFENKSHGMFLKPWRALLTKTYILVLKSWCKTRSCLLGRDNVWTIEFRKNGSRRTFKPHIGLYHGNTILDPSPIILKICIFDVQKIRMFMMHTNAFTKIYDQIYFKNLCVRNLFFEIFL